LHDSARCRFAPALGIYRISPSPPTGTAALLALAGLSLLRHALL